MELQKDSFTLNSKHGSRPFLSDLRYINDHKAKPVVLFVHGFKGFKDWGHFDLIADEFAQQGYAFVKMNLSHNGTTPEAPMDFADLEAFGHNNFEIELDDIGMVIDHIHQGNLNVPSGEVDVNEIYLIGHSRGGGISIIKAASDRRIKRLATWAAVADFETWWSPEVLNQWKSAGVYHIFNSRTKQDMPMYYQIIGNFEQNKTAFSIPRASKELKIPFLIVHGTDDETVPLKGAHKLNEDCSTAVLCEIEGANHTFGGSHPYTSEVLPEHTAEVVRNTINFFRS